MCPLLLSVCSHGIAMDPARPQLVSLDSSKQAAAIPEPKRQKTNEEKKQKYVSVPVDPTQPFALQSRQPWADRPAFPEQELTDEQRAFLEKVDLMSKLLCPCCVRCRHPL